MRCQHAGCRLLPPLLQLLPPPCTALHKCPLLAAPVCTDLEPGFALVNEKGKVILTFLGDGPDARVFTKAKRCPQSYYW